MLLHQEKQTMEKNQQNTIPKPVNPKGGHKFTDNQPGQQLPANADNIDTETGGGTEEHSESSFPQSDNETLGTP